MLASDTSLKIFQLNKIKAKMAIFKFPMPIIDDLLRPNRRDPTELDNWRKSIGWIAIQQTRVKRRFKVEGQTLFANQFILTIGSVCSREKCPESTSADYQATGDILNQL